MLGIGCCPQDVGETSYSACPFKTPSPLLKCAQELTFPPSILKFWLRGCEKFRDSNCSKLRPPLSTGGNGEQRKAMWHCLHGSLTSVKKSLSLSGWLLLYLYQELDQMVSTAVTCCESRALSYVTTTPCDEQDLNVPLLLVPRHSQHCT